MLHPVKIHNTDFPTKRLRSCLSPTRTRHHSPSFLPSGEAAVAVTTWKRVKTVRWQEENGCAVAVSHFLPLRHPSRAQAFFFLARHLFLRWGSFDCVTFPRVLSLFWFFFVLILSMGLHKHSVFPRYIFARRVRPYPTGTAYLRREGLCLSRTRLQMSFRPTRMFFWRFL